MHGTVSRAQAVSVTDEARHLLVDGGWLAEGNTGKIVLEIEPHLLGSIQCWLDEKQPLTFSDVTQIWSMFNLPAMRPADSTSRSEQAHLEEALN